MKKDADSKLSSKFVAKFASSHLPNVDIQFLGLPSELH